MKEGTKEALMRDYDARRCCICRVPASELWLRPAVDARNATGVRQDQAEVEARLRQRGGAGLRDSNWRPVILVVVGVIVLAMLAYSILGWTG